MAVVESHHLHLLSSIPPTLPFPSWNFFWFASSLQETVGMSSFSRGYLCHGWLLNSYTELRWRYKMNSSTNRIWHHFRLVTMVSLLPAVANGPPTVWETLTNWIMVKLLLRYRYTLYTVNREIFVIWNFCWKNFRVEKFRRVDVLRKMNNIVFVIA